MSADAKTRDYVMHYVMLYSRRAGDQKFSCTSARSLHERVQRRSIVKTRDNLEQKRPLVATATPCFGIEGTDNGLAEEALPEGEEGTANKEYFLFCQFFGCLVLFSSYHLFYDFFWWNKV